MLVFCKWNKQSFEFKTQLQGTQMSPISQLWTYLGWRWIMAYLVKNQTPTVWIDLQMITRIHHLHRIHLICGEESTLHDQVYPYFWCAFPASHLENHANHSQQPCHLVFHLHPSNPTVHVEAEEDVFPSLDSRFASVAQNGLQRIEYDVNPCLTVCFWSSFHWFHAAGSLEQSN